MSIKEQYLHSLKTSLLNYFDNVYTEEILADYSDFFDAGLQDGKSEQELINEFGEPSQIADRLCKFKSSEKTSNQIPEKSLIIAGRIILISATIAFMLFLRVIPNLTDLIDNFLVSLLLPISIMLLCAMIYAIHVLFRIPIAKANSTKKKKDSRIIIICSYIIPIILNAISYSFLIYGVFICSPNKIHMLGPYDAMNLTNAIANPANIAIIATCILSIIIAIRSSKFSIIKSSLQLAVAIPSIVIYRLLRVLDLSEVYPYSLFMEFKSIWATAGCTILLIITIHLCIKLITNNKKSLNTILSALLITAFAVSSFLFSSIVFNKESYNLAVLLISGLTVFGIFVSLHTKQFPNFFIAGKNTNKYALIGIVLSSVGGLVVSAVAYTLNKSYFSQYSSTLDQHIISSNFFAIVAFSSIFMIILFVCTLVYIINGKSNNSHRYLCLIGFAPLIVMNNLVDLYGTVDTQNKSWYMFLSNNSEQMWRKTIIMCVIVIAVPLITFGVLQIRKLINDKTQ